MLTRKNDMKQTTNSLKGLLAILLLLLAPRMEAQIKIGGNVYGGGNAGNLDGRTTVTVRSGNIRGGVFGGARQANISGSAFVNIDGTNASSYILINKVYGGNDIAGIIGSSEELPSELTQTDENGITPSWNAFVRVSSFRIPSPAEGLAEDTVFNSVYIGQLFGGGNGEYIYSAPKENGKYDVHLKELMWNEEAHNGDGAFEEQDVVKTDVDKPELGRAYMEIVGGSIIYAFGGGNNVTVSDSTVICVDNPSKVVNSIVEGGEELLNPARILEMGVNPGYTYATSDAFQIGSFFGGNNVAEMAIRPVWNLKNGSIRNLYSGGNRGAMTSPVGLLLEIPTTSTIKVDNVYGGCRMADVRPQNEGVDVDLLQIQLNDKDENGVLKYRFPAGLSARVLVRGGDINNVYGGNDISGQVYGGNAVGVYANIRGDIYGGGNGSYPYTDNALLVDDQTYGDLYYNPDSLLAEAGLTGVEDRLKSVTALNLFRPHAEQVSIRVAGTSEEKPTLIGGAIYVGGNSATLIPKAGVEKPMAELKIGSYVIADKVFLGNNGESMVDTTANGILATYAGNVSKADGSLDNIDFSTMTLTDSVVFDKYMEGVALEMPPSVVFDNERRGDPATYVDYKTYFGSFYCGGNIGSLKYDGAGVIDFEHKVVIFDKLVGGSNKAYVKAHDGLNAAYEGGIIGAPDATTGNKLVLNLTDLKIQPMRWKLPSDPEPTEYPYQLVWNTVDGDGNPTAPVFSGAFTPDDLNRRFTGGNVYGGCCESGIVNGNVVINIDATIIEQDKLFDAVKEDEEGEAILYGHDEYTIETRRTGVILGEQGMDVLGKALNVFGGGKGKDTEIWGSTTINLNAGYIFQIFGGSEEGVIGKPDPTGTYQFNGKTYKYDPKYSCYVNLKGDHAGVTKTSTSNSPSMADCEFMYGGGFLGPIVGNTVINLGNGRIFNSFAGSCNADILGHTETYIGRMVKDDYQNVMGNLGSTVENDTCLIKKENYYEQGFPWIRDIVYGGNDLGGEIMGEDNFKYRVRQDANFDVLGKVHKYHTSNNPEPDVLKASAYVEYLQGRADGIFGGCYGTYDYKDPKFSDYTDPSGNPINGFKKPRLNNAFVNFRPTYVHDANVVEKVYGAGQGYTGEADRDKMQNRSYVLIDIPQEMTNYENMEVFGAGAWGGVGMHKMVASDASENVKDSVSAIIDLMRGQMWAAYGASYKEGFTRRTVVNVPKGSTIQIGSIFGGGYGVDNNALPCDAYEAHVEYHSADAVVVEKAKKDSDGNPIEKNLMTGAIYGGNNSYRRTLYSKVNIDVPVYNGGVGSDGTRYMATVYGAGYGKDTWAQYTEVNLLDSASVYEVYGGGMNGRVMNQETVAKWAADNSFSLEMGGYIDNGLENLLAGSNALADDYPSEYGKCNTNVHIHKGALVSNYAYGGGQGTGGLEKSGDVNGTTYIGLLGGTIKKDIYAAGTIGAVLNGHPDLTFKAGTHAYVKGGTVRNVYGGGWRGDVGYTAMTISEDETSASFPTPDRPGVTHVVIGVRKDQASLPDDYGFYNGVPTIQRNAYSGGEGGAIFGTANLVINNGCIGYEYDGTTALEGLPVGYKEKIEDETYQVNGVFVPNERLIDCGNVFGGGYDVRSSVDTTIVKMWSGIIRNSLHGGGEIATIGRGAIEVSGQANSVRRLKGFYKAGKTNVEMFNGHVLRNVFGGGKGYNLLGYGQGQGTLYTDGYVFGQTEVHIHGGEVGTKDGVAKGYGNVFGGGDIGYVYSPSVTSTKTKQRIGTSSPDHIYYYNDDDDLEEDCKVVIAPWLQVRANSATINGKTKYKYEYFDTDDLNTLGKEKDEHGNWTGQWANLFTGDYLNGEVNPEDSEERGVHIHNAVFGGGNVSSNSDQTYANAITVYGNTTATLYDIYHRDFITVGTEHIGGLYGGGNLSMVDGYRELNITNYGTDYYGLKQTISIEEYRGLSNRERAYFQLEYKCIAQSETQVIDGKTYKGITIDGVFYKFDQRLTEEEYLKMLNSTDPSVVSQVKDPANFEPYGFCSIYAGRLLNTIQRADFCGVFGSRMVLQGAKDRVAEVGEDIDYTINRVGELSLNQQRSVIPREKQTDSNGNYLYPDEALHGNYFGIYSVVNYLGNMTSDVHFGDEYRNPRDSVEVDKSYYTYKAANPTSNDRNKGRSFNQVALASGVFLELTTENSTKEHKDYGYVTGVIELDLINVKKDLVGGGFVYAKNEHRVARRYPNKSNVILSAYNRQVGNEACTYKQFRYSTTNDDGTSNESEWTEDEGAYTIGHAEDDPGVYDFGVLREWETSGNFIHHEKRIVDDCYPTNNAFDKTKTPYSEAHYWYVKGDVYIYDQKVSAYTGSATAYSKEVHLPLTITAASHGQLQLLNVKPNLYAYYTDKDGSRVKMGTLGADGKPLNKVTVNNESDTYELNDVVSWWDWHQMSPTDRQYFVPQTYVNCVTCIVNGTEYAQGTYVMDDTDFNTFKNSHPTITDKKGDPFLDDDGEDIGMEYVFRSSNNIGHETGYVLTFDMNSPAVWDNYYSPTEGVSATQKISTATYESMFSDGMSDAARQAILDSWREGPTFTPTVPGVYGKREYKVGEIVTAETYANAGEGKEKMEPAYVATASVTYTYGGVNKTVNKGTAISKTEYEGIGAAQSSFAEALFCTNTVKLTNENYMLYGELLTESEIAAIKAIEGKKATDQEIDEALTPAYICTENGTYGGQQFDVGTNYSTIQAWCSLPFDDRQNFTYNYDALDLLVNSDYLAVNPNITTSPAHETTVAAFHAPYTDLVDVEYQAVFKKKGVDVEYNGSNLVDGAILTNEEFENGIRNDRRHYTHVEVKHNGDYVYLATNNFIYLGTPYGRGQVVDVDVFNANQTDVEAVQMDQAGDWYYCYEDYTDKDGVAVAKGTLIGKTEYATVPNDQQYFVIQGKEPTETTTLYVSRESNIQDLTKEKIVTVVYQYTYYEDEDDGSVKLTNELHVINIHLQLESGVPTIGTLYPPSTVLPGEAVGLKAPEVNPGLYEVLTSGWELFTSSDDADNHRNGVPFTNNTDPVYWYQNNKNFIAFYSKTYLGKTYSNYVPLSVANYHDMAEVMADKEHHMFVDKSNVDRPCKIYINDYTSSSQNGLDLLKDFVDLSNEHTLSGHSSLSSHVRGGENLEFYLRTNINHSNEWTPIANETGECFSGHLHGDGYMISGLNHSLFNHLCGNVYNLGVTGSFTSAGIAEEGEGYVENCWIKTTGTPETGVHPIFNNPTRDTEHDDRGPVQVENCYYPESNNYQMPSTAVHGKAMQMPDKDFYNGTVAYNLNGFYLKKRYYQGTNLNEGTEYKYLLPNADGTLAEAMATGYYPDAYAIYRPDIKVEEGETLPYLSYVEHRFYDGDFIYADGNIPEGDNIRKRTVTTGEGDDAVTTVYYSPIWPDDYIFFGQALNYGHVEERTHQEYPSHINKNDERLLATLDGNRVYRAPAYFRSKEMEMVHFNPYAVFAQTKKDDADVIAYKNMTAIDFTGHQDYGYTQGLYTVPANQPNAGKSYFYPPLLDDDGLSEFKNVDLTKNLVVYTGIQTPASIKTDSVVSRALPDVACVETHLDYRTVKAYDKPSDPVHGHWVQWKDGSFVAKNDHLLVDMQDFNAPFGYTFASGKRMWYQREPDRFVDRTKGWETVSLPFEAELVTTDVKGEITHFYKGSTTGHEYWLREYAGKKEDDGTTFTADFNNPDADAENSKTVTNTFLWDYYYKNVARHNQQDLNNDVYQTYYESQRTHEDYPYLTNGTPYIIGFPGKTYYEFDLSGEWKAETTAYPGPAQLETPQTITFASQTGATISVSDDELKNGKVTASGYTFMPNYMGKKIEGYLLNAEGNVFDKTDAPTEAVPFRPYFVAGSGTANAPARKAAQHIIFTSSDTSFAFKDEDPTQEEVGGELTFYAKKRLLGVKSTLHSATDVLIANTSGLTIASFTIQPNETIETHLPAGGIYIIRAAGGKYNEKISVK